MVNAAPHPLPGAAARRANRERKRTRIVWSIWAVAAMVIPLVTLSVGLILLERTREHGLERAVKAANPITAHFWLTAGANPNRLIGEVHTRSLLDLAVRKRNAELVRTLLAHGADPDLSGCESSAQEIARDMAADGDARMLRLLPPTPKR